MVCVCAMNMALERIFVQGGAVVSITAAHREAISSNPTRKACVSFLVAS